MSLPMKYRTEFMVVGDGPFPVDMLRFAVAVPAREQDSHVMGREGKRQVTLRRFSTDNPSWSDMAWEAIRARFKSFGWTVDHIVDTVKL